MKRWLSLATVVVMCLALVVGVACGGEEEEEEGVTEVKLGFGSALSGLLGAVAGIPAKKGMELLADMIGVFEVEEEQYRWKILTEDTEGFTAAGGVAIATKFIYEDDVDFIVTAGAAALAARTLCEESEVILDVGTTALEVFGPDYPYTTASAFCVATHVACFYDWLAEEHPEVMRIVVGAADDPATGAYNEAFGGNMDQYFGFETELVWIPSGTTEYYPTATAIMAEDPDLVIATLPVLNIMWELGYDGLAAGYGPIISQSYLEQAAGWDDCNGLLLFFPEWYGAEEAGIWPGAVAYAREYEARYGEEMGSFAFASSMMLNTLTGASQQAGTVDDTKKIMEVIHSEAIFDSFMGPVYYGGEGLVGINCMLMWPVAIWEVVGEREYELVEYYTPEETEAIATEAWTATMP